MKVQWGTSFHQFNVIVENKTPGKVTVFMLTSTESLEQIICTANPKPGSKGVALAKSPEYFTISAFLVLISSRIQSYLSILMFTSKLRERRKKNPNKQVFGEAWTFWFSESDFQTFICVLLLISK